MPQTTPNLNLLDNTAFERRLEILKTSTNEGELIQFLSVCNHTQLQRLEALQPTETILSNFNALVLEAKRKLLDYKLAFMRVVEEIRKVDSKYQRAFNAIANLENAEHIRPANFNITPDFFAHKAIVSNLRFEAMRYLAVQRYHNLGNLSMHHIRNIIFDVIASTAMHQGQLFVGPKSVGQNRIFGKPLSGSRVLTAIRRSHLPEDFYAETTSNRDENRIQFMKMLPNGLDSWRLWIIDKIWALFFGEATTKSLHIAEIPNVSPEDAQRESDKPLYWGQSF